MMKARRTLRLLAALVIVTTLIPSAMAGAAAPPAPTYGTAVVDGNAGEWILAQDFFANMHRAGDPDKELESKAYVRYDCATSTVYVLVLTEPGVPAITTSVSAWIAIDEQNNKVVNDASGDNGIPPDFAWIGQGYDGDSSHALGFEASFTLAPGTYELIVHVNVLDDGGSQTSATTGFPHEGPPLTMVCFDWGDLPSLYPTTLADDGARHSIGNLFLGGRIDGEPDGQPHASALGDDGNNSDDEDGVVPTPGVVWSVLDGGSFRVFVSGGNGCLSGWMDFNKDGDFDEVGEQIYTNEFLTPGEHELPFDIPLGTVLTGDFFARFRLYAPDDDGNCDEVAPSVTGEATNGEVEDYIIDPSVPTSVTVTNLTARAATGAGRLGLALGAGGVLILAALAFVLRRR